MLKIKENKHPVVLIEREDQLIQERENLPSNNHSLEEDWFGISTEERNFVTRCKKSSTNQFQINNSIDEGIRVCVRCLKIVCECVIDENYGIPPYVFEASQSFPGNLNSFPNFSGSLQTKVSVQNSKPFRKKFLKYEENSDLSESLNEGPSHATDYLKVQIAKKRNDKPFKCEFCPYSGKTSSCLKDHKVIHRADKPYTCDKCSFSSKHRRSLREHLKLHIPGNHLKCDKCSYTTKIQSYLNLHRVKHAKKKPFKCSFCPYSAKSLTYLKKHTRIHDGKIYKCVMCPYSGKTSQQLQQHLTNHTADRPFKCQQCSFSAATPIYLRRHLVVHTKEKPFACDKCSFTTKHRHSLTRHLKAHSLQRPYYCGKCPFASLEKALVVSHAKTHCYKTNN